MTERDQDTSFSAGQDRSFAVAYDGLASAIHGWARLRVSPTLQHKLAPEDLVQEIWWRALDAYDQFDAARGSFRSWIFTIANNVLLDALRSLRSRREIGGPTQRTSDSAHPEELVADVTSISLRVARDERLARVLESASSLDDDDRRLLCSHALEGLTLRESGELIGLSKEAATKRWQRLKARLIASSAWHAIFDEAREDRG